MRLKAHRPFGWAGSSSRLKFSFASPFATMAKDRWKSVSVSLHVKLVKMKDELNPFGEKNGVREKRNPPYSGDIDLRYVQFVIKPNHSHIPTFRVGVLHGLGFCKKLVP